MKLSKRGEYGLRTLIHLGIAQEVGREVLAVSDLSAADHLPLKYVEQILAQLRHEGIVGTRRGKYGGYFLKRPADGITIGEIVRLFDGMLAPIPCASEAFYQPCTCADEEHCGLRMLMIDVRNAISNLLDRYTLADVVGVTLRKLRRDNLPIPFAGGDGAPSTSGDERPSTGRNADPKDGFLELMKEMSETVEPTGGR
jgi:Rrf2 family protein